MEHRDRLPTQHRQQLVKVCKLLSLPDKIRSAKLINTNAERSKELTEKKNSKNLSWLLKKQHGICEVQDSVSINLAKSAYRYTANVRGILLLSGGCGKQFPKAVSWIPHSTDCSVCERILEAEKGNRMRNPISMVYVLRLCLAACSCESSAILAGRYQHRNCLEGSSSLKNNSNLLVGKCR